MAQKAAMWVHGTIVEVEYPERLAPGGLSIKGPSSINGFFRKGWGTHFWGKKDTTNWFHIPITTPVILDDVRPPLTRVYVFYETKGWVKITNLDVYDGKKKVKAFAGLNLAGDHSGRIDASNSWEISPSITLAYGLGISVGVEFGSQDTQDTPWPEIIFTTAGADFKQP